MGQQWGMSLPDVLYGSMRWHVPARCVCEHQEHHWGISGAAGGQLGDMSLADALYGSMVYGSLVYESVVYGSVVYGSMVYGAHRVCEPQRHHGGTTGAPWGHEPA